MLLSVAHTEGRRLGNEVTELGESKFFSFASALAILAVYSYFTGWVYAYRFFRNFGIHINSVEIPLQHFYVYSFTVFVNWLGLALLLGATLAGYAVVVFKRIRWITIPLLVGCVPLCFWLAVTVADQRARAVRQGYDSNRITFHFKKDGRELYPKTFREANSRGGLRLITQTKDRYFVLWQPSPEPGVSVLPYGSVYHVSKDDIILATVDIISE